MQMAWANYDENGFFINITSFYGSQLKVIKGNKILINNEVWIVKDHISHFKLQ